MPRPNYGGAKKPRAATCAGCGKSLATGAKTVIDSWWYCAECTYKHDYPNADASPQQRPKPLPLQEETLFPLPTKVDRG